MANEFARGRRAGIVALASILVAATFLAMSSSPARANPSVTQTITLFGDATMGWGFANGSEATPGPPIYAAVGDSITLNLHSVDGQKHNWFVDINNNSRPASGMPISGNFTSSTSLTFTVTAAMVGTNPYRCEFHPGIMVGYLVVVQAPTYTLFGNAVSGWGTSNTSISTPGPALQAKVGTPVTLELVSADGQEHSFFLDLNGNGAHDSGEPLSPNFGGSNPHVIIWTFTPTQAGNISYRCAFHPTIMIGTMSVAASGGVDYAIYIVVIVIIVVLAVVVTIVVRRRPKAPTQQEPPKMP